MTTTIETRTDAKAGFCQSCREGRCALCASPKCTCPDGRKHRNRPDYGRIPDAQRSRTTPGNGHVTPPPTPPLSFTRRPTTGEKPTVIFELVEADPPLPPAKPRKLTNVEKARPFLEQIMAEGKTTWHRLAVHPSARGAGFLASTFRKAYPKSEWEFRSVSVAEIGQSAVYVRWLGETPSNGSL